jgi:type II secretory pathway component GspD/PulD (secretin)
MQTIPQDGPDGYYDILDPTKATQPNTGAPANNTAGAAGGNAGTTGGNAGAGNPGAPALGESAPLRAKYIMLIGEPRRLNIIETYVRDLDKRITESFSLAGAANYGSVVVPVISGQTQKIKDMLNKLLEQNPRKNDYTIEETSVKELAEGDDSLKMLLIAGPKDELETLRIFADQLDASMCELKGIARDTSPESFTQHYEVVDLKFIEPVHAEFDLKSRVRGLYVSILPDPVTPGLTGEAKDEKVEGGDANAQGNAGAATAAPKNAEIKREVGHEQMRLVLRGTRAQIAEAKAYLAQVDMPARQVSIELRVMEINKADALKIGLDWSVLTGGRLTSFRMNQGLGGNISQGGVFNGHYQDNATTSFDVLGQLDQITTRDNLIARPNALITDGRSSHLFVGDTVRYIKLINASQNGTTVEIGEVEVGVKVDVEARVGSDGNIALNLMNNFSILRSFTPVPGGGAIPQTSDRMTEMFVNMRHGETIALGGLILEQDRRQVSGIPILKDIPIIGNLFKRTENNKTKTEIVFFLTATVIDNGNKATAADPRKGDGQAPTTANNSKGN